MQRQTLSIVGNAVLFQLLWLAAILGAGNGVIWPGLACLAALFLWSLLFRNPLRADLRMALIGVLVAYSVEPIWIGLHLVEYPLQPDGSAPPIWIVLLWAGFAMSCNHSLAWLRNRLLWGSLLGTAGGIASITAANRLGVVGMPNGWLSIALLYGLVWSLICPALVWLSMRQLEENPERTPESVVTESAD